jgi:penicillin-insensitive murein endopeptidase
MPKRELSRDEREEMSATMAVAPSRLDVDHSVWTPAHGALIRAAAEDPKVQRVFVNAAIKKALCREAGGDGDWLNKVRPYWGHDYHFHVRLACPSDSPDCKPQDPVPPEEGCGKDLDWWFRDAVIHPKPEPPPDPTKPRKPRPQTTMKDLPPACRAVLAAP